MAKQKKRGPGRPPKKKSKIEIKKAARVSAREIKSQNHIESGDFSLNGRDSIIEQAEAFNKKQALEEVEGYESEEVIEEEPTEETTETVEEEAEATEEPTETALEEVVEETVTETTELEEEAPTETATETAEFVKEKKEDAAAEPIKTVPHGAFHAEREGRKEERNAKEKALTENRELKKKLAEQEGGQQAEQTEEAYVDPEIAAINKRLDARDATDRDLKAAQDKIDFDGNVRIVHESLLEQGIDGFDTIGKAIVDSKLREMYAENPAIAVAHDNPEGWAKLYLEALPELQKIGKTQHKSTLFDEKKKAKEQAGLITASGKKPLENAQPKKKKTPEQEYLEQRSSSKI